MTVPQVELSVYALVNQESGNSHRLVKGKNIAGRCRAEDVHLPCLTLRAVVSSRRHAEVLVHEDNTVSVYDVGSGNGTYINDVRITPFVHKSLKLHDTVGFGMTTVPINEFDEHQELPVFQLKIADDLFMELKEKKVEEDDDDDVDSGFLSKTTSTTSNSTISNSMIDIANVPAQTKTKIGEELRKVDNQPRIKPVVNKEQTSVDNSKETSDKSMEIDYSRVKTEDCIIEIEDDEDEDMILSQAAFAPAETNEAACIAETRYFDIKQELDDFGLNTSRYLPTVDLTVEDEEELNWVNGLEYLDNSNTVLADKNSSDVENNDNEKTKINKSNKTTKDATSDVEKSDESDDDSVVQNARSLRKRQYSRIYSDSEFDEKSDTDSIDKLIKKYVHSNKFETTNKASTRAKPLVPDNFYNKQESASRKVAPSKEPPRKDASSHDDSENTSKPSTSTKLNVNSKTSRKHHESSDDDLENNNNELETKRSTSVPAVKKLKAGSNFVESRMDTKGIQLEWAKRQKVNKQKGKKQTIRPAMNVELMDRQARENIVKERKEKLKNLYSVNAEASAKVNEPKPGTRKDADTVSKGTAKVKVSKGRGEFLCDEANKVATRSSTKYKIPPVIEPHRMDSKVRIAHNRVTSNSHQATASLPSAVNRLISTSTSLPLSPSQLRIPAADINIVNPLRHLPPKVPCLPPPPPLAAASVTSIFVHPAVYTMIQWSSRSFNDYHRRRSGVIPGLKDGAAGTLKHTRSSYDSYEQYREVMEPLMTIEMWMAVYEDWSRAGSLPDFFRAKIEQVDIRSKYTSIQCKTYISSSDFAKPMFKKAVLLIGSFQIIDQESQKRSFMQLLTYIHHLEKRPLHINDEIPPGIITGRADFVVYLTLLTKTTRATMDTQKLIKCEFVSYVGNNIKLFDAVQHLQHSPMRNILLNPKLEQYDVRKYVNYDGCMYSEVTLNETQRRAVLEAAYICSRTEPMVYLIDGPPGTGKTTVITQILKQLLFHRQGQTGQVRILVVAPSNGAIDNLALKIIEVKKRLMRDRKYAFKVIRVGSVTQMHPEIKRYCIEDYADKSLKHTMLNDNAVFREEHNLLLERFSVLRKQRETNIDDPILLRELQLVQYKIENFARSKLGHHFYEHLTNHKRTIINRCHVICSTLSSCFRLSRSGDLPLNASITCCIVDEATQSVEQDTLIPLLLGVNNMILVGDPQQLPAVTSSPIARSYGYGQSLFARIKLRLIEQTCNPYASTPDTIVQFLDTQYRMHPQISLFPNHAFYNGRLRDAPYLQLLAAPALPPTPITPSPSPVFYSPHLTRSTTATCPPLHNTFVPLYSSTPSPDSSPTAVVTGRPCPAPLRALRPYMVIRQSERDPFPSQQYGNQSEVELVVGLYREIGKLVLGCRQQWSGNGMDVITVGIITPYNKQKEMIESGVKLLGFGSVQGLRLTVTTVDGVQGQEKDIVILSNVRMHGNSFVENENRLNVALTRAKHVLYIVGSEYLFEESKLFREIERDAIMRNLHATIPNSAFAFEVIRAPCMY